MSRNSACPNFRQSTISRRRLLSAGGAGLLGLNLPSILRAADSNRTAVSGVHRGPKPRAKSVIFLFQWGGPSHIDTFDMKPDAPDEYRGPLNPISSSVPGLPVCEELPEMAKRMDRVTLIRSVTHTMKNHNSAGYYALTGHAPPSDDQRLRESPTLYPGYGSIVDHLSPVDGGMPTYVSYPHVIRDGSITPGQGASFLGKGHDPLFFSDDPNDENFRLPELSLPQDISLDRLSRRRQIQQLIDQQARLLDTSVEARGLDEYYTKAISMLTSDRVRNAFDLSSESSDVRDKYGRTTYGQSCLLARRLVESGVKFVTVYFSNSIGGRSITKGGWDTHGFDNTRMFPIVKARHFPMTEHTLPVLLDDLEERGLFEETLVVWMGEFGRTPRINKNASRDHWPRCYTVLLAGGGVKRGFVYGASDSHGMYPAENAVKPDDLAATFFYLLGIDPTSEIRDRVNRPLAISGGQPILDVIS